MLKLSKDFLGKATTLSYSIRPLFPQNSKYDYIHKGYNNGHVQLIRLTEMGMKLQRKKEMGITYDIKQD